MAKDRVLSFTPDSGGKTGLAPRAAMPPEAVIDVRPGETVRNVHAICLG